MRFSGLHPRLSPVMVVLGGVAAATVLVAQAPTAHARNISSSCTASSPCSPSPPQPSPTPTPVNAFLTLDVTSGDINTSITVTGGNFLAGESVSLYWDDQSKVAGSTTADSRGNFTAHVKPFAGDSPGVHKVCASVAPNPCASFTLQGTSSPSPSTSPSASPSPTESPSATPSESPSPSPSATPVAAINGLDVITKPPLVFLPIIVGLGLLVAIAFWAISLTTRRRVPLMPAASVSHLATRPDYSAGFGTPPPLPAQPAPPPSAWPEATPAPSPETTTPPEPEPQASPPEPQALAPEPEPPQPDLPVVPDEPPDLPEPGE
jgi:hypothetical protein